MSIYGRIFNNYISFGLDYGECFTLLDVIGVGKATPFKILMAAVLPSEDETLLQATTPNHVTKNY